MRRTDERGFSLVEVVIALGLLAGVLISITGLFIMASKEVKAGRKSSEALAVGKEIVEEMNGWGYSQIWGNFGFDGAATTYTVDCRANTVGGFCPAWQTNLTGKIGSSAYATIKMDSMLTAGGATTNFADPATGSILARNVRLLVTVNWTELTGRIRSVQIETSRN
jgi:type II secretory pathway pseudopilin PulG